jgi:aspartate aminotransferase-like enzyme
VSGLLPSVDPDGLREYSVVYTDRATNHMSKVFQESLRDIVRTLKTVYNGHTAVILPGSGTFGMEAVARQFATGKKCLVIRNGWFSYRWTQIFEMGRIPSESVVLMAGPIESGPQPAYAPAPIDEVVAAIEREKPDLVFAPHVETSAGMILPDDYLRAVANAVHTVGGLFVLDCIASGAAWVDMRDIGVDILISAPQKNWSAPACCGLVMLSPTARDRIETTTSTSFAADLKRWLQIVDAYEQGGHAYHATLPTDALRSLREAMRETEALGFAKARKRQFELGRRVRAILAERGIKSVAADGFGAPGVVVCYTTDDAISTGKKFAELGLQIAASVPLQCGEGPDFKTFRLGLFGLDKLYDPERTVATLAEAIERIGKF